MIKRAIDTACGYLFVGLLMAGFISLMYFSWRIDHTFYCR